MLRLMKGWPRSCTPHSSPLPRVRTFRSSHNWSYLLSKHYHPNRSDKLGGEWASSMAVYLVSSPGGFSHWLPHIPLSTSPYCWLCHFYKPPREGGGKTSCLYMSSYILLCSWGTLQSLSYYKIFELAFLDKNLSFWRYVNTHENSNSPFLEQLCEKKANKSLENGIG